VLAIGILPAAIVSNAISKYNNLGLISRFGSLLRRPWSCIFNSNRIYCVCIICRISF
jgi:hypothetical protein